MISVTPLAANLDLIIFRSRKLDLNIRENPKIRSNLRLSEFLFSKIMLQAYRKGFEKNNHATTFTNPR